MTHAFIDDGYPEADDYVSNYVWFDERDPDSVKRAMAARAARPQSVRSRDPGSIGLRKKEPERKG
jgi:hypothetical protein